LKTESKVVRRIEVRSKGYLGVVERIGKICGVYCCVGDAVEFSGVDVWFWGRLERQMKLFEKLISFN